MYNEDFSVNRRSSPRETVEMPAQYFIKKQSARYMDCSIVNLSRSGAGVLFPEGETLDKGALIFLEVVVPRSFEQVTLRGEIKRNFHENGKLYGGIQFDALVSEDIFSKLVTA